MFLITGVEVYSNGRRRDVQDSPGGEIRDGIKFFPGGDFFLGRGGGIELDPDEGGFRWRVSGENLTSNRGSAISIELVRFNEHGEVVERRPLDLRTDARGSTGMNREYAVFNGIHASLADGGNITARLLPNRLEKG